jgi:peptide/nickel transport system permease protein
LAAEISTLPAQAEGRWKPPEVLRRLLRHRLFVIGALLLLTVAAVVLLAPLLAPYDPVKNDYRYRLGPPNAAHLLGTDSFGRDVLSRTLYGGVVSLRIGFFVMLFTGVIGTLVGLGAGYFRRLEAPIMRLMDALMAFPGVLLAIALAAVLGCRAPPASCVPPRWW